MQQRQGILLIRLKSMGDIVFTLPAVHALRANFPTEPITFLVSREYSGLLAGFKSVDSTIEIDRSRFRGLHPIKMVTETLKLVRQIREGGLRLAIDFQGYGETALLSLASGAVDRWGTVYRRGRKWAYTRAVSRDSTLHPAADFLALLTKNGVQVPSIVNHFSLPQRSIAQAGEFFASHGLRHDRPVLFLQPFTSAPHKNWPLKQYLEVAQFWRKRGWQILFGGGPADRAALEPARAAGYVVSAGSTILISAGLANRSTLIMGGDTGLLHLAVAMGKRVVMLMPASTSGAPPFEHRNWAIAAGTGGGISSISPALVTDHCEKACVELSVPLSFPVN